MDGGEQGRERERERDICDTEGVVKVRCCRYTVRMAGDKYPCHNTPLIHTHISRGNHSHHVVTSLHVIQATCLPSFSFSYITFSPLITGTSPPAAILVN